MKIDLIAQILCFAFATKVPLVSRKSKLCGNEQCDEVLFKAKVKREMGSNHEAFLSLTQDESIDVTAVKFSDRTDLMEGVLKDGRRGNFYISAIDIEPYVRFLRNAIELKKEMMEISQDRADIGSKKFLGTVRADLHLVRDYNVQASRYAEEQNISQPELLPLPDLTVPNLGSHGNEHEGENGHGHGILHGSHGLNLNDVGSENFGSVHSDDAAHLGTFHDSAHEGTPTDHFQSLGETTDGKLKPMSVEKLSSSDNQNSVKSEAESAKSTFSPVPTSTSSPSELARQEPQAETAAELTTPQPVIATSPIPAEQYVGTTYSNEKETVSTEDRSIPVAKQILDSGNETNANFIPALMDRYSLSSQSITISSPLGHDVHVSDSNVMMDPNNSAHEAFTSTEDRLRAESNIQSSSNTEEKLDDVVTGGIDSLVNEAVIPSSSPQSPQYCTREDCSGHHSFVATQQPESAHMVDHITPSPSIFGSNEEAKLCGDVVEGGTEDSRSGFIASMLGSLAAVMRSVPFLEDLDNAGIAFIINMSLLIAAIVFHLILSFLSDFSDSNISDRMVTHDLATKCKFLDEQIKIKDMEINRLTSVAGRLQGDFDETSELRKELCVKEIEIENHVRRSECLNCELDEERRMRVSLENDLALERKNTVLANEKATEVRRLLSDAERAHSCTMDELSSTRKALKRLEQDLHDERQIHEETAVDFKKVKDTAHRLQTELQLAHEEIKKLESEKNNFELENTTLSCLIEEMERNRKEGSAGESGGSGGWSDFGDDITGEAEDGKERASASSTVTIPVVSIASANDIREAARLHVQLKKTEQEFNSIKIALDKEKEERRRLESKLIAVGSELDCKKREVEERERDRSRADDRCNELLAIMRENNVKARETESLRDKLRDEITTLQRELCSTIEDKIKKEEKIIELESSLKHMRNEHLKLETRRFNEVMELKRRVDVLQANQSLAPSGQTYDLTQSASSLERDSRSPVSLWEEAPLTMNHSRINAEDGILFGSFSNSKKGPMHVRRSDIIQREHSPSDGEKHKERKESSHRRIRSRSNGRKLWNGRVGDSSSRHAPVEPTCPPSSSAEFGTEASNRRRNRTNTVYYSSGGSNGGRSPPPEMPLLSAVPPPGVKKPAGKRAVGPSLELKQT